MQIDDLVALGIVLAAAAWLARYFVRRIRRLTRSQETPSSKLMQITIQEEDKREG